MTEQTDNEWDPEQYDSQMGFVADYGERVVELLDPSPGERILDLGCGTGQLTAVIAEQTGSGGAVVGIDLSAEMIERARERHPDIRFERIDATAFVTDSSFDAVFSNATLHWIADQAAVIERVADTLAPGGRFVAELGGSGNVGTILDAVLAELRERGYDAANPWYFPTIGEHASVLEEHGFEVRSAVLFDRPTELSGADGLGNWLDVFGDSLLAPLSESERDAVVAAVEDRLREDLYDAASETWTADYRRLRFVAVR